MLQQQIGLNRIVAEDQAGFKARRSTRPIDQVIICSKATVRKNSMKEIAHRTTIL